MLWGNVQKRSPDLYLLVVAGLVFPGTGTATATRGDTAFGRAVAEFLEDAQTGSTSGAGNVITLILAFATGPVGPLKSFTRIDR